MLVYQRVNYPINDTDKYDCDQLPSELPLGIVHGENVGHFNSREMLLRSQHFTMIFDDFPRKSSKAHINGGYPLKFRP